MFVLMWVTLLCSVTDSSADRGASGMTGPRCDLGFCISLSGDVTAEAGLCATIQCSFTVASGFDISNAAWSKCRQSEITCRDTILQIKTREPKKGRLSLLEPDLSRRNCSIIINDLDQSDSGSYQFRVNGRWKNNNERFTFLPKASVSVKALTQKPTVEVPPLIYGQQSTLTCTAPGLCSGSDPNIIWTWRRSTEKDSHITGNITTTHGRSSFLTFTPSAQHHGTEVTCKVNFRGSQSTRETVTLNVTCVVQENGGVSVIPLTVTVISLSVNILLIVCLIFLWNSRKKTKQNPEDHNYLSLDPRTISPDYDVIARRVSASVD